MTARQGWAMLTVIRTLAIFAAAACLVVAGLLLGVPQREQERLLYGDGVGRVELAQRRIGSLSWALGAGEASGPSAGYGAVTPFERGAAPAPDRRAGGARFVSPD